MTTKTPILRERIDGKNMFRAVGGLHFIRGNRLPYFSLCFESWYGTMSGPSGAAHDEIVRLWPELAPLAALHLSDINGVPMHAADNGFYWLAGAVDHGFGAQYHGGSGQFGKAPEECLSILADHLRIDRVAASALVDEAQRIYDSVNQYDRVYRRLGGPKVRSWMADWCKAQEPRWKAEADRAIAEFGLVVYGDPWAPAKAPEEVCA